MELRRNQTAPAVEPVTVDHVKAAARIDGEEFDLLLPMNITAARVVAEHQTGRILAQRVITVELDGWPDEAIAVTPVSSVVVTYYTGSAWATLATTVYEFIPESSGFRLALKSGQSWPTLPDMSGAVVKVEATTAAEDNASAQQYIIAQAVYWTCSPGAAGDKKQEPSPFLSYLLDPLKVY